MSTRSLIAACILAVACGTASATADPAPQADSATVAWHCYRSPVETVLATAKTDGVGSRFLARKTTGDIKADCMVEQRPGDFVIGATDDEASNYIDLVKGLLLLDDGTGPDRTLVIYDLPARKKLLSTGYSVQGNCDPSTGCRVEDFSIDDRGLTFWRETQDKPNAKNCKGYAGFMKTTGSAAIEEKSLFNFVTYKVEPLGGKRCVARQ